MRRRPSDPTRFGTRALATPAGTGLQSTPAERGNGKAAGTDLAALGVSALGKRKALAAKRIATGSKRQEGTGAALAIIPRSLDEVERVARAVLIAKLAPASYMRERGIMLGDEAAIGRLVVGIMKGAELGFPPITALSTIAIINQKPCIYGDGASALIQSRGHLDSMTVEEIGTIPEATTETRKFADDYGVRVTMWRKGQRDPYVGQFTVGDAKRARLWMDPHREPWVKYPRRQLKWRAFSWPARDGFADDLMGLSIAEEMLDVPPESPPRTDTSFLDEPEAVTPSDKGSSAGARTRTSSVPPGPS